ncbi:unnamed protein product [Hydatigera taeniaeformis]|uniref:DUF4708 domain-containing protein n=1 Tax=Hydatigena taeniaeformis TaxID=6205 RepID=A0A0R3XA60_HYDTA|nr:unnamed protein product [Hydatigera taeniaeformis]
MIDGFLECRCVDNVASEEEEMVGQAKGRSTWTINNQVPNPSYVPYGIDGPRISITGASSVLMRYVSLLKTDTSYPLKILYSVHKEFCGYRVHMLMPPPSPLQDIIKGPLATQLVRLNACTMLVSADIALIAPCLSQTVRCTGIMEGLTNDTGKLDRRSITNGEDSGSHSVVLKARPSTMSMEEKNTIITTVSTGSIDRFTSNSNDDVQKVDVEKETVLDVVRKPLSPSMVYCGGPPPTRQNLTLNGATESVVSPHDNVDGESPLDGVNICIAADELPSKKRKSTNRPLNIPRFYPIHKLSSLSAPYQQPIKANQPVHLYVWQMPLAEEVASLIKVNAAYFRYTDQTIGLLFSKPISKPFGCVETGLNLASRPATLAASWLAVC